MDLDLEAAEDLAELELQARLVAGMVDPQRAPWYLQIAEAAWVLKDKTRERAEQPALPGVEE